MRRFGVMHYERGFTLVEIMLVVVLMTIFFALGQGSNKSMDNKLIFMREESKITAKVYEVRSKVLASYADGSACGFGISVKDSALFAFRQEAEGGVCREEYFDGEVGVSQPEAVPLEGVTIPDSNFSSLLFVPPHLDVAYNFLPGGGGSACFDIVSTSDSDIRSAVKVNRTGQIAIVSSCN